MAKLKEPELDPSNSYEHAMRRLIAARFGAVWAAVPVAIEGADLEGVHDVRVASRRLRAAMDVAVDCFPEPWYTELHEVAKSITTELGEVRDRDVMLEFLAAEREQIKPGERAGIDRLMGRVVRERDEARTHMLAFLERLESEDVAGEAVRRFGPEAAAPWMDEEQTSS